MSTLTADDKKRLERQLDRVLELVRDKQWWTLHGLSVELENRYGCRFPESSVSARLRELRHLGYKVERDNWGHGLFAYRVTKPERVAEQEVLEFT